MIFLILYVKYIIVEKIKFLLKLRKDFTPKVNKKILALQLNFFLFKLQILAFRIGMMFLFVYHNFTESSWIYFTFEFIVQVL